MKKDQLEVLGGGCSSDVCPTVYRGPDGKIYIQGDRLQTRLKQGISIGEQEDVVEITPAMLEVLKNL
jgi:hypothetical protein